MSKMKIYISGSISKNADYKKQFEEKLEELKKDYVVLSPLFISAELEWKEYMKIDLAMIDVCDTVYMMKGWKESKGAKIEECYAGMRGKKIIYEENKMTETSTPKELPELLVNIKLAEGGQLPVKKTAGAACYDCYAAEDKLIYPNCTAIVSLGFMIEVPEGYYAEIRGRSGNSCKGILTMTGTVDSDYRGIVGAITTNLDQKPEPLQVKKGDRIAQMMIKKVIDTELVEASELTETVRGTGGFGSTGK